LISRETARGVLGKHELAVYDDIEYAFVPFDQLDLSPEPIL
jgi:hypothetical protein